MADKTRWGILATGRIAHSFATGLKALPDAELVAVGSRAQESADKFAAEFNVPRAHASYEALAADPQVDAIYVSTPHPMHKDNTILCLNAGKAVLCEKPFTINARDAAEVVAVARRKKVFLMEAMWSRFLPPVAAVRKMLADGAVGDVRMVSADFGFRAGENPASRLFDPALGGGGLLDVGVYAVSFCSMVLGEAAEVAGVAEIGGTGVDSQAAVVMKYAGGRIGQIATGVRTGTPMEATIMGTDGYIRLHRPWWRGGRVTLHRGDAVVWTIDEPVAGNGYNYEAAEVAACLRAGKTESAVMPLDETLAIMRTLDRIRAQWGLKYPME